MSNAQHSKETIKARMYARVSELWDVRSVEQLDPIVKLMVDCLSAEIFGLSVELDGSEDTIVDKLARTFTPHSMMTASPAHALLHARADRGSVTVDANTEFAYKEPRFTKNYSLHKLPMTPVCGTRIFNADVVALIAANRFWCVSTSRGKTRFATSTVRSPIFNSAVWIGIGAGNDVRDLNGMSFWFDFPGMDDPFEYAQLIEYGVWSHYGAVISTAGGLPEPEDAGGSLTFGVYDPRLDMLDEIKWKYNDRFVSIRQNLPVKNLKREKVPVELAGMFDAALTSGLSDGTIWFKVALPPAFDDNGLNALAVHANCFPVANIYTKSHSAVTRPHSPTVELPIERNEHFLFVGAVRDSTGREYRQIGTHTENDESFAYSVRGGVSKQYSSLDTRSFIDRLVAMYSDESIAFSGIGIDVAGVAEKIIEHLSMFEKRSQAHGEDYGRHAFLILNGSAKEALTVTTRYALTNGSIANRIGAYEMLSSVDADDGVPNTATLMTPTRGGGGSPSVERQRDIFQYLMMSHDRIYTKADMMQFCRAYYGDHFTEVRVENGHEVSKKPKHGVIQITKIILKGVTEQSGARRAELANDILAGLKRRSPDETEYRIVFE